MTSYRSHPFSGGQGVYLRHLTKALADLGCRIDVVSGPPYPDLDRRVRLIRLPSLDLYAEENAFAALRPRHLVSFTDTYEWAAHVSGKFPEPYTFGRRLARFMADKADRYDVVHDNQTLSWGVLGLRGLGLPLVTTLHHPITVDRDLALQAAAGWTPSRIGLRMLIRRWHSFLPMQMAVARKLDHLITISESSRRDFAAEFGLDTAKIKRIYLGIDTEQFYREPEIARDEATLICTSSADVPLKGLVYLIEALGLVRSRRPEVRLTVIGKLRDGLAKKTLQRLRLEDAVTFRSGVSGDELRRAYNQAAIAVAPSLYEGFGFPAGEAMACGAPVVAAAGGALPEGVGEAGVVVPPADASALANAIEALLADPQRRERLSAAGLDRVRTAFSWRRCASQTLDVYKEAIASAYSRSRALAA